jgi:hypothetical protein
MWVVSPVNMVFILSTLNFGVWFADRFPSKHNALALWGHGDGWSKGGKYIGYDERNLKYLYVSQGELKAAVNGIVTKLGKPLDLIVIDVYRMQMAEALMGFKTLGRFAVGSLSNVPVKRTVL